MRLGPAEIRFTNADDGDFAPPATADDADLLARRARVVDAPWTWLRQVHGRDVIVVDTAGEGVGAAADAAISVTPLAPVAVVTADCAPIVLVDDAGAAVGVVHAGWRGLGDGVVQAATDAMRARGATTISAALGPCIHAECYEFAEADLDRLAQQFGDSVRGTTRTGAPALDVPAAVRVAVARAGADLVFDAHVCTSCAPGYWSHRARNDAHRQATVAWLA